jgi:DNA-binding MarR family transcriptional regulator
MGIPPEILRNRSKFPGLIRLVKTFSSTVAAAGLPLAIGMAYLNYQSVLAPLLRRHGLDTHLRPGMGNTLFALFAEDGLSMGALAANAGLALATVSEVVERMERAGLVRRKRATGDGRMKNVFLTARARRLEARCRELNDELVKLMTAGLKAREIEQLVRSLGRISLNLTRHLAGGHTLAP